MPTHALGIAEPPRMSPGEGTEPVLGGPVLAMVAGGANTGMAAIRAGLFEGSLSAMRMRTCRA